MKPDYIQSLTTDFESKANRTQNGLEFWYARDLQMLLGYSKWENFLKVIEKAKVSCENAGLKVSDHLPDVRKVIKAGKGATLEISDYMLTRYACYLIAQNGNPSKTEIAFAQTYFAVQTRNFEIIQERIKEVERVKARDKLSQSEKQLSGIIFEKTKNEKAFGLIRSLGDKALFGLSTEQMKVKWAVPRSKPLADFAPTIVLKGKDFANEMTVFNTKEKQLSSQKELANEHLENNSTIRKAMLDRGITPENLRPEPDVKKIKRKLITARKKALRGKS